MCDRVLIHISVFLVEFVLIVVLCRVKMNVFDVAGLAFLTRSHVMHSVYSCDGRERLWSEWDLTSLHRHALVFSSGVLLYL